LTDLPSTDLVLDLDTGTDDALALLLALRAPGLRLRAVTCVDGNVEVDRAVANTLRVLDAVDAPDVPVARGADRPLRRPHGLRVGGSHGPDGLGGVPLPPPTRTATTEDAAVLLQRLCSAGPVAYAGCGPATNLAAVLAIAPELADRLRPVVLVAGPDDDNFNSRHDPHALAAVRAAGLRHIEVQLPDLRAAVVDDPARAVLAAWSGPSGRLAAALLEARKRTTGVASMGDAVAVARLLVPAATPDVCVRVFIAVLTGAARTATDIGRLGR
jgi:pyrimidine-specific ribonucleoside hydrolase